MDYLHVISSSLTKLSLTACHKISAVGSLFFKLDLESTKYLMITITTTTTQA